MQSVHVQWLDDFRPFLYFQFDADFTVEDYRAAVDDAWQLLDGYDAEKFYVVADVSQMNRVPAMMITTMFKEYGKTHPLFGGFTILIGAPRFIQMLVEQFQSIFHTSKFGFANHLNDLDTVIAQYLHITNL